MNSTQLFVQDTELGLAAKIAYTLNERADPTPRRIYNSNIISESPACTPMRMQSASHAANRPINRQPIQRNEEESLRRSYEI